MAMLTTRNHSVRRNIALMLKGTVALASLAILGYVAVVVAEHSGPLLSAASQFALEGQMVSSETAPATADSQAAGTATAAVPATPAATGRRDFDYFPDHYVNQATKIEDPIPTF